MKIWVILGVVFVCFVGFLYIFQRNFFYFPNQHVFTPSPNAPYEKVEIRTRKGEILSSLWAETPYARNDDGTSPVIVFFHGNAGRAADRLYKIKPYLLAGFHVLLAEYSGYAGNDLSPSEKQFYYDAADHLIWLKKQKGVLPHDVIFYGESIGGGVATHIAALNGCQALVLETPFTSLPDVVRKTFPWLPFLSRFVHDIYNNEAIIKNVKCSVFISIAGRDKVVPPHLGQQLFEKVAAPKTMQNYPDASHNNVAQYGLHHDVIAFLRGVIYEK